MQLPMQGQMQELLINDTMPRWRKSQYSNPSGNCVEVATVAAGRIGVRNSRDPAGGILAFPRANFRALLAAAAHDTWGAAPPDAGNIG